MKTGDPIQENARVIRWERIGTIFPSDWKATLADGRVLYIRYRHGGLGYGIGESFGKAVENHKYGMAFPSGTCGSSFLSDSQMIIEMRLFGVSFENAERIGPACEEC